MQLLKLKSLEERTKSFQRVLAAYRFCVGLTSFNNLKKAFVNWYFKYNPLESTKYNIFGNNGNYRYYDVAEREEYYASSECDIRDYWVNVGENIHTRNFMLSQVTSPLISYETYVKCINDFNDSNSISTVTQVKDYLWQGSLTINYELPHHPKSQDLPNDIFKLNFGVCIMSVQDLEKWRNLTKKRQKI